MCIKKTQAQALMVTVLPSIMYLHGVRFTSRQMYNIALWTQNSSTCILTPPKYWQEGKIMTKIQAAVPGKPISTNQ